MVNSLTVAFERGAWDNAVSNNKCPTKASVLAVVFFARARRLYKQHRGIYYWFKTIEIISTNCCYYLKKNFHVTFFLVCAFIVHVRKILVNTCTR